MPRSKPKRSSRKKPQKYDVYDTLWDESPRVQKMKEQIRIQTQKEDEQRFAEREKQMLEKMEKMRAEFEAKVRANQESEAKAFRQALVSVIRARFPNLTEFAQQQVELFDKPGALDLLIQQVSKAPDANTARWLLDANTGNA